ncbi:MAG TPA: transposase [Gammaproteobacteria bacterium]|nr:transposase [Gammaproteobacteria bacterium]
MGLINDIFRIYGPKYLDRYGESMPVEHKKVIDALCQCRTETNGSIIYHCEQCSQFHSVPRSCGNRHCPGCQHHKARRQLPGHHFMLTFTVRDQLRPFIRSYQRLAYAALFETSADAIKTLAKDPTYLSGDTPGFFGVLHTWGRQLQYHPHIHYLVPGGALSSQDGQWHPSSPGFFLPVKALSKIFRAKFQDQIEQAGLLGKVPPEIWTVDWNVNCQAVGTAEATLNYLAPYIFKVAISESRIIKVEGDQVFFRYKKPHSERWRIMALPVMEFMRRFLQHVLPTGFMKVRDSRLFVSKLLCAP